MFRPRGSLWLLAGLTFAGFVTSAAVAAGTRPNAIERYGLSGFVLPVGLHHGFHIEKVVPDSPAERDRLAPHDIIVKVDGEEIRSLEHLRTLLTDIDEDDGVAELTIIKKGGLEHHVVKCHLKPRVEDPPARKADPGASKAEDRR
jgi:S1-C subfamily serine protease